MIKTIEREKVGAPRRFRILHGDMLTGFGFEVREQADPNVCFIRAEDKPDKDPDDDGDGDEDKGTSIPTKCAECGVENAKEAKFCMGCGKSMATKPMEEEPPPPSSKPGKPVAAQKMVAPAKMSADVSLAAILGATGESPLALKTAAIGMRQIRDTAAGVTRETSPGKIVGALLTVPERLERADLATATAKQDAAKTAAKFAVDQQWGRAKRLNKLGLDAWPRDAIFRCEIRDGKSVPVALQPTIEKWDAEEFEGYVSALEKSRPQRSPFETKRAEAETDAKDRAEQEGVGGNTAPRLTDGKPTKTQIDRAKKDPTVLKMFNAQGNTATLDMLAEQYVIAAAQNGVALGGVS